MPRLSTLLAALVCALAAAIFFLPPPQGVDANIMHAAALLVLTIGLWALGTLPELFASVAKSYRLSYHAPVGGRR